MMLFDCSCGQCVDLDVAATTIDRAIAAADNLLLHSNVDKGHGIDHAIKVYEHGINAIVASTEYIPCHRRLAILLACLLHDVDDRKFFTTTGYANAKKILADSLDNIANVEYRDKIYNDAISMISMVSTRSNLNNTDDIHEAMLIPRYADRLEAMGIIGIRRAYEYTKVTNRPIALTSSPTCESLDAIVAAASAERFRNYASSGSSASFIDHFFDKILHLVNMTDTCSNKYIIDEAHQRHKITLDFLVHYGKTRSLLYCDEFSSEESWL